MRKIGFLSVKGGVGKSTISLTVARMLMKKGYRVGLIDADISNPNIPIFMGIDDPNILDIKFSSGERIKPKEVGGLKFFSIGLIMGRGQAILWDGGEAKDWIMGMFDIVDWGNIDYLIVDMPPQTSDIANTVIERFNKRKDGFIIVTTSQKPAIDGALRTVDALKFKKQNIGGVVVNMAYFICSKCGNNEYLGMDKKEIEKILGLKVLSEIPFTKNPEKYLDIDKVLKSVKRRLI